MRRPPPASNPGGASAAVSGFYEVAPSQRYDLVGVQGEEVRLRAVEALCQPGELVRTTSREHKWGLIPHSAFDDEGDDCRGARGNRRTSAKHCQQSSSIRAQSPPEFLPALSVHYQLQSLPPVFPDPAAQEDSGRVVSAPASILSRGAACPRGEEQEVEAVRQREDEDEQGPDQPRPGCDVRPRRNEQQQQQVPPVGLPPSLAVSGLLPSRTSAPRHVGHEDNGQSSKQKVVIGLTYVSIDLALGRERPWGRRTGPGLGGPRSPRPRLARLRSEAPVSAAQEVTSALTW
jgi:hypothetical protein